MKKIQTIFFLITLATSLMVRAQTALPIKEQFDWLLYKNDPPPNSTEKDGYYEKNWFYDPNLGNDCYSCSNAGEGMPYLMNACLKMYETTKDKGYLFKVMNEFINYHNARNDIRTCDRDFHTSENQTIPYMYTELWSSIDDNPPFYYTGYILQPMAKFLFMINKKYPDLLSIPIPQNLGEISSYTTIGSFAATLKTWVDETISYINVYSFLQGEGFLRRQDDGNNEWYEVMVINMQSKFAVAYFYMYATYNDFSYYAKFATLYNHYTGTYKRCKGCSGGNDCVDSDVFMYDPATNSYYWEDQAWQDTYYECDPPRYYYFEDMSHAATVLDLPLNTYQATLFSEADMIRWHNTFTKKLWANWNGEPYLFYNNVFGDHLYYGHNDEPSIDANHFQVSCMNYMPFEKFDGLPGAYESAYDIVMNVYANKIYQQEEQFPASQQTFTGQSMEGVSNVVTAQWGRECPDLTLKNRGVIYSQDFFSKNTLVIDPVCPQLPIFEPRIEDYRNLFVIEPTVFCTTSAANEIILKPGFNAKTGSNFRAYIDPGLCSGQRLINPALANNETSSAITIEKKTEVSNNINLKVYPNPANYQLTIEYTALQECKPVITMNDVYGKIVLQTDLTNAKQTIDISILPTGVYLLKFVCGEQAEVRKFVKQ